MQLRMKFNLPERPMTVSLALSGLYVLASSIDGTTDELWQHLSSAGASPRKDDDEDISFPVKNLRALSELPKQLKLLPDEVLEPLYMLVMHPPTEGAPASLVVGVDSQLHLSWSTGDEVLRRALHPQAAAALVQVELPFIASPEAWDELQRLCRLPTVVARAKLNLDGYIELFAPKPQLLESAPPEAVRGLFRIDVTHFGVPLGFASDIDKGPGLIWEGRRPQVETAVPDMTVPVKLRADQVEDLAVLVRGLTTYKAQAVVAGPTRASRTLAAAALECLDAWPAMVVAPPAAMWPWQRVLSLFARSCSLVAGRADVHICTYMDLHDSNLEPPQAVVFDDLVGQEGLANLSAGTLARLGTALDAYRLALTSTWPVSTDDELRVMSVLRPGEFRADLQAAARYLPPVEQRAREHIDLYLLRRAPATPGGPATQPHGRSEVVVTGPTEAQIKALASIEGRHGRLPNAAHRKAALLADLMEVVTAGPEQSIGPKVVIAAARAKALHGSGKTLAIVTRHRRAVSLLRGALRPARLVTADLGDGEELPAPGAPLVLVRFDGPLVSLRAFDEVMFLDYPWSLSTIERAVGPHASENSPMRTTIVHMVGTLDDRLAMLATRRRELGSVVDQEAPPNEEEIHYLLKPRYLSVVDTTISKTLRVPANKVTAGVLSTSLLRPQW